ncbi:MAG: methionine adenosyltransferase [Phyllobacterium sp.]|uniref:methionine adenosyltransferase n=1 Tax=Phyllobacterium sp. TaxID=1871046 RepID=UPI0030F2AD6C
MSRSIVISQLSETPMEKRPMEMCEHKGIGHPDTMIDGICETASRDLSRAYLKACGRVLHHNLDKGLLISGTSAPRFGGGKLLQPMKAIICGKATSVEGQIDPSAIAVDAATRFLRDHIRCPVEHFQITTEIKQGSNDLTSLFGRQEHVPLANDTSFGVAYAPYSKLENAVLDLAQVMKSPEFRQHFPAAGDDYKIMGYRIDGECKFIVALAFIDRYVESSLHYFSIKQSIHDYLGRHLNLPAEIQINTSDHPAAEKESDLYLTVLGLSAEMGDDGQVGRGNRVNGLITPDRVMSLEAAAGKNPTAHVGKIYNVLAYLMAHDIVTSLEEVSEVKVQLLSAIGSPVDSPELVAIEANTTHGLNDRINVMIASIAEHWLASTDQVTDIVLSGDGAPCCQFINRHSTRGQ